MLSNVDIFMPKRTPVCILAGLRVSLGLGGFFPLALACQSAQALSMNARCSQNSGSVGDALPDMSPPTALWVLASTVPSSRVWNPLKVPENVFTAARSVGDAS